MKRIRAAVAAVVVLACAPAIAEAQNNGPAVWFVLNQFLPLGERPGAAAVREPSAPDTPDHRGEVWGGLTDPVTGTRAQVRIPLELRQRNSVGIDFLGLCVIASQTTDGRQQGRAAEVAELWAAAKQRTGGYSPDKLKRLVAQVCPGMPYLSYEGADTDGLARILARGIPVGVTYSTGKLYGYRHIAHMVSLVHLDARRAAVIDNNKPEVVAWMPRAEFDRRFRDRGEGWAFLWQIAPPAIPGLGELGGPLVAVAVGGGLALAWVIFRRRREATAAA